MDFEQARKGMVTAQLAHRGVRDARVLDAMGSVPREAFVDAALAKHAYQDNPLPIGEGQTISQPYIVAAMAEAAQLKREDRVLEVGAGSGYAAAILSRIAGHIFAIERHDALTVHARTHCAAYPNITLKTADGSTGWTEEAPFDAILVAASVPKPPEALKRQLKVGGRLIVPMGEMDDQRLIRMTRTGDERFEEEDLGAVRFVPLIGAQGWPE